MVRYFERRYAQRLPWEHHWLTLHWNKSEIVLVSRSANDTNGEARPLIAPSQEKYGATYHALFQMLSRFLGLPDGQLLKRFRRKVQGYVRYVMSFMWSDARLIAVPQERSSLLLEGQSASDGETIRQDLAHMLMIKGVIDDQIEVLESLRELFEQCTGFGLEDQAGVDRIDIPHLSDRELAPFWGLGKLITERKRLKEKFIEHIDSLRKLVRVSHPTLPMSLS
jgi:hypothetical protein